MRSRLAMSVSSESSEIRADAGILGLTQPAFAKAKRLHFIYAKFLFLEFLAVAIIDDDLPVTMLPPLVFTECSALFRLRQC